MPYHNTKLKATYVKTHLEPLICVRFLSAMANYCPKKENKNKTNLKVDAGF